MEKINSENLKAVLGWLGIGALILVLVFWGGVSRVLGDKEQHKQYYLLVNTHVRDTYTDHTSDDKLINDVVEYSKSNASKEYKKLKADIIFSERGLFDTEARYISLDRLYINNSPVEFDDCNLNESGEFPNSEATCSIDFDDGTTADLRIKPLEEAKS